MAANETTFRKGQSKVPGCGRKKGSGFDARCREWSARYGIAFLEAVARGNVSGKFNIRLTPDLELRTNVAKYLIDRGGGRPRQAVELNAGDGTVKFTLGMGSGAK